MMSLLARRWGAAAAVILACPVPRVGAPQPPSERTCAEEIGEADAARLAERCICLSSAARPCNATNPCRMIRQEIVRSCGFFGDDMPPECDPSTEGIVSTTSYILALKVIDVHMNEVHACHAEARRRNPSLAGWIDVALAIAPEDGQVRGFVVYDSSTIWDAELVACLRARAETWRFGPSPFPDDGSLLRHRFNF